MKAIPRSVIEDYTKKLNAVSAKGQAAIAKALKSYNYTSIEDLRLFAIELMAQLGYGCADAAASLSADFYDDVREASVGKPLGAEAYVSFSTEAMEASVRYLLFRVIDDGNTERFTKALQDKLDFTIKKASGDCVEYNVSRDPLKPKYARVPTGAETCEFCIMLASRGFVYNSANTAGAHYHANCDCRVVPGFDGINSKVEGYDPDSLCDDNYLEAQKAVEDRFTTKEWVNLDYKDQTKLILKEMRHQRKAKARQEDGAIILKEYDEDDLIQVVKAWTSDQSSNIRAYQQGYDMPPVFGEYSGMIERYISLNENYEGPIWRGINVNEEIAKSFVPKKVINQKGTSSWSTSASKSAEYASSGSGRNVIFVSTTKRGASVREISEVPDDDEILLSRSTDWRILDVAEKDGIIYVYCEELKR